MCAKQRPNPTAIYVLCLNGPLVCFSIRYTIRENMVDVVVVVSLVKKRSKS